MNIRSGVGVVALVLFAGSAVAQIEGEPIGDFQGMLQQGRTIEFQSFSYEDGVYTLTASSAIGSVGGFASQVSGDFTLRAKAQVQNLAGVNLGVAGLFLFATLEANDRFLMVGNHTDSYASIQHRITAGAPFVPSPDYFFVNMEPDNHAGDFEIIRTGDTVVINYFDITTDAWELWMERTIDYADPVYVMLGVTSFESGRFAEGTFSNVVFTPAQSSVAEWELYQ